MDLVAARRRAAVRGISAVVMLAILTPPPVLIGRLPDPDAEPRAGDGLSGREGCLRVP